MRGRSVRAGAGTAALLALAVLAGCSAGGNDSGAAGESAAIAPAAPAPAKEQVDAATGSEFTADRAAVEPALIRTAELTVVVDDLTGKATTATTLAQAAGGGVFGDDREGTGDRARATLVLRVPPARMGSLLDQLAGLGEEQQRTSTTKDVTEEVADVGSRVASMKASIARVRAILSRADKIGDVVAVEGELSRRTTELESLQARQRALAGDVGYATVTAHLLARAVAPPVREERAGFLGGLRGGWDAFAATVSWLLLALGTVLPFLLLAVPAALAARWVLRRRRPVGTPVAAPAPPATG